MVMSAIATARLLLFFLFVFLQTNYISFSQTSSYPIKEWEKKLGSKTDNENESYFLVRNELNTKDSAVVDIALHELEGLTSSNHYLKARVFCLKAFQKHRFGAQKSEIRQSCEKALAEAYITGDDYVISFVSFLYGELMSVNQELELAAIYYLKADAINERLDNKLKHSDSLWLQLGAVLFFTREYEKSIYYIRKGLDAAKEISDSADHYRIIYWNTIGQDYQKLGQLDSALVNYQRSMQVANKINADDWKAINSGFMGQVFFLRKEYDKAKQLLEYDYNINKDIELNIAGYTLQWLAKISLIQGKKDSALWQVKLALHLLQQWTKFRVQGVNYLQYVYYTTADVYRAIGNTDSFYHYFQLYSSLHDSLERVAALSSIKMAQVRNDSEKNFQTIQSLESEKKAEEVKRNFILIAIVLLAAIVILILNRQRQRSIYKQELALQQKIVAETEVAAAKEQLNMFKDNIIETTSLIEKLQEQALSKEMVAQQSEIAEELSRQTILTEEDWDKFKKLFEKIYPGFFAKLKEKSTDITVAEQRMAALTRLHLTTKQMASMLGISVDSVHKTRQRLRQRLQLGADINLEETIAHL
jgi:hypothetical protein